MKKHKGINARAWFYSQSFVSSASSLPEPSDELKQTVADLKAELAKLQTAEPKVQQ